MHQDLNLQPEIVREWLLAFIDGSRSRVVLLQAPAGFGKTVAMRQCRRVLDARGTATRWLTLETRHANTAVLLAALESLLDDVLEPRSSTVDLFARLKASRLPFALFLDGIDSLPEAAAVSITSALVEHLPSCGRMFLATRRPPDFALGRLMVTGDVLMVGTQQLRMRSEEALQFLRLQWGDKLTLEQSMQIDAATDGWPAAISLAAMDWAGRDSQGGASGQVDMQGEQLSRYMDEEVLQPLPEAARRFLADTAVLQELDAAACEAVTGLDDAGRRLDELHRHGLVLRHAADGGARHVHHRLLREFLAQRLQRHANLHYRQLHLAAARWYAQQEEPVQALAHVVQGGDHDLAVRLLTDHGPRVLAQGHVGLLARCFGKLPPDVVSSHPTLASLHAWAQCFTHGPAAGLEVLDASGRPAATGLDRAALETMRLILADQHQDARTAGLGAAGDQLQGSTFAKGIALIALSNVEAALGDPDAARDRLEQVRSTPDALRPGFHLMYSEAVDGCMDLIEGRIRQARARFRMAVGAITGPAEARTRGNAWAAVLLATCLDEAGEDAEAAHLLHACVPRGRPAGHPEHLSLGYVLLARLAFRRGDIDAAMQFLVELEHEARRHGLPRLLGSARLERAGIYLALGRSAEARNEMGRADAACDWHRYARLRLPATDLDYPVLARLRWELVAGSADAALSGLDQEIAVAERLRRHRRALKLRVLRCGALHRLHDSSANAAVQSVLEDCSAEGYVRMLLDEAGSFRGPFAAFCASAAAPRLHVRDPLLAEYFARLRAALEPAAGPEDPDVTDDPASGELSGKELKVLQLLALGESTEEMARRLFVSKNTVRTHLRSINAKLGAHTRIEAVAIARRAGLLA